MSDVLDNKLMADLFGDTSQAESNQDKSKTEGQGKPVYEVLEVKRADTPLPHVEKKEEFFSYRPELLAVEILRNAVYEPDLLDLIKERASIRWVEGLSDSLFNAVLCRLKPLNEQPKRNEDGQIVLQPRTNWDEEIAKYMV